MSSQRLWPFDGRSNVLDYDLYEFILYAGLPVLIFFLYRYIVKKYYKEKVVPSKIIVLFYIIWVVINLLLLLMYFDDASFKTYKRAVAT